MALLRNASFEQGTAGWKANYLAPNVKLEAVADGTAKSGKQFLRCSTAVGGASVAYDTPSAFQVEVSGYLPDGTVMLSNGLIQSPSFGLTAWIRSAPGGPEVAGVLTIWDLTAPNNHPDAQFTVGQQWEPVSNAIDIAGPTTLRVELYMLTPNAAYDMDNVILA